MLFEEKLREEREQGRAEGRQEERVILLNAAIDEGIDEATIYRVFGITEDEFQYAGTSAGSIKND